MLSRLARTTLRKAVPARSFHGSAPAADKIVLVLYPDPTTGYPPNYARDDIVSVVSSGGLFPHDEKICVGPSTSSSPPPGRQNLV